MENIANEILEKEYAKLLKLKKQYSITVYVGVILSILFAILCYLFLNIPIKGYLAILGFFTINFIFIFVIAKDKENNFYELYNEIIIKKVLSNNFENVDILLEKENKHKINLINIFTEKNITTSNYVKCEYKNLPFEIIEARVKKLTENWNNDRHSTSYIQVFNGLVYCYKIDTENKNNINIISKYYMKDKDNIKNVPYIDYKKTSIYDNSYIETKNFSKIELNRIDIQNEKYKEWFSIYADCNINEECLCNNIFPLLLELREQVNKKIFIIIQENKIYLGVNNYYNLYKNDILSKKESLSDEIKNLTNHINLVKQIIDKVQKNIDNIK